MSTIKLYAIRDRMLDYYQRPVFADRAPDFLSAVANAINTGGTNDFCQTPEHFEIWELGEFDVEKGTLTGKQTIIANCASLVRNGVREERAPARPAAAIPPGRSRRPVDDLRGGTTAEGGPVQNQAHATPGAAQETREGAPGSDRLHPHHREDVI